MAEFITDSYGLASAIAECRNAVTAPVTATAVTVNYRFGLTLHETCAPTEISAEKYTAGCVMLFMAPED